MRSGILALAVASALLAFGAASAEEARPVAFTSLADRVDADRAWATIQSGPGCRAVKQVKWREQHLTFQTANLRQIFASEVRNAHLSVAGGDSLFDADESPAEFQVAGAVVYARADFCGPDPGGYGRYSGSMSLDVEWQIYSVADRKVLATIRTASSGSAQESSDSGNVRVLTLDGFTRNVRNLLADERFRDIVYGKKAPAGPAVAFFP